MALRTDHVTNEVIEAATLNELATGINELQFAQDRAGRIADMGAGDDVAVWNPNIHPRKVRLRDGTAAAPVTTSGPTFKVSRTEELTEATIEAIGGAGTDGSEQVAAIAGVCSALATAEVQPVGILGSARTTSTTGVSGNDALGVYGFGRAMGALANGTGIGGFFLGRRDVDTARTLACEMHTANSTATDTPYVATGFSSSIGVWVNCSGSADSSVGVAVSNAFGRQFEVGFAVVGQTNNLKTGGARVASFRDDGNAITVHDINGSHTDGLDFTGATFTGNAIKFKTSTSKTDGIAFGDVALWRAGAFLLSVGGGLTAGRVELNNTTNAGFLQMVEQSTVVATPVADTLRLYAKDDGAGNTRLYAKDPAGVERVISWT